MTDNQQMATIENVLVNGDLTQLSPGDRVMYYNKVCESAKLNPLTRPFEYIRLNGKLTLYARKDCTDQLRTVHSISIKIVAREKIDDVYIVTAQATNKEGRCDESTGAVSVAGLKGEALANAYLKAETKAKRRVTLSLVGLGLLDENEVDSIPNAARVDFETGEITEIKTQVSIEQQPKLELAHAQNKITALQEIQFAFHAQDRKAGFESYMKLSKDEKKAVWSKLNPEEKAWVASLKPDYSQV